MADLERQVLDLSGSIDEVWTTLSSAYGIAEQAALQRAQLREQFDRDAGSRMVHGVLPCAAVIWLGVACKR